MKLKEASFDKNNKLVQSWNHFDIDLNHQVSLSGNGGVVITLMEEDEFGNTTQMFIELSRQDIELINKTKL